MHQGIFLIFISYGDYELNETKGTRLIGSPLYARTIPFGIRLLVFDNILESGCVRLLQSTPSATDAYLVAVQARLARRQLPTVAPNGLILYALQLPSNGHRSPHHPSGEWRKGAQGSDITAR